MFDDRFKHFQALAPNSRVADSAATIAALVSILAAAPGWEWLDPESYFQTLLDLQNPALEDVDVFGPVLHEALRYMCQFEDILVQHVRIVTPTNTIQLQQCLAVTNQSFIDAAAKVYAELGHAFNQILTAKNMRDYGLKQQSRQRFAGSLPKYCTLIPLAKLQRTAGGKNIIAMVQACNNKAKAQVRWTHCNLEFMSYIGCRVIYSMI